MRRLSFEESYIPVTESGCWLWDRGTTGAGYGLITPHPGAKMELAHRFSYRTNVGPIPKGMEICHKCDVRSCVNPSHLFLGTRRDNMLDCWRKGRGKKIQSNRDLFIKVSDLDVLAIRGMPKRGERGWIPNWKIADMYGLRIGLVNEIRRPRSKRKVMLVG
jgi:HNH endonuclease